MTRKPGVNPQIPQTFTEQILCNLWMVLRCGGGFAGLVVMLGGVKTKDVLSLA